MTETVIENITSEPNWKEIFLSALNYSDEFKVIFPKGSYSIDNPLQAGMIDIQSLKNTSIESFDGMDDSIAISGRISEKEKSILKKLVSPSFDKEIPDLWWFTLYNNNQEIITISDFTVCIIHSDVFLMK